MPIITRKDDVDALMKRVRKLVRDEVLVGIPDTNADREPTQGEGGTPPSNALIGYIMETGSPARNIPPRPFLTPGIQDARQDIVAQMRKGGEAALAGKTSELEQAQNATGLVAQSSVKTKIASNVPPPLSARTLAARRRRGVTRENTLVDTGQLLNAVTYVVRPKGA